jgi:hypothetical protein
MLFTVRGRVGFQSLHVRERWLPDHLSLFEKRGWRSGEDILLGKRFVYEAERTGTGKWSVLFGGPDEARVWDMVREQRGLLAGRIGEDVVARLRRALPRLRPDWLAETAGLGMSFVPVRTAEDTVMAWMRAHRAKLLWPTGDAMPRVARFAVEIADGSRMLFEHVPTLGMAEGRPLDPETGAGLDLDAMRWPGYLVLTFLARSRAAAEDFNDHWDRVAASGGSNVLPFFRDGQHRAAALSRLAARLRMP